MKSLSCTKKTLGKSAGTRLKSNNKICGFYYRVENESQKMQWNKTSCLQWIKFIIEDTKIKHTDIATIWNDD
jgi:hypothetical protein